MRLYLDVCCLSRPFDDQSQERIRLESEAVELILGLIAKGKHRWVSSEAIEYEISRHRGEDRRVRLQILIKQADERLVLDNETRRRAIDLESAGLGAMDAVHLAIAERHACDVFLTTDDRLLRRALRAAENLRIRVANPVQWVMEDLGI